MAGLFALLGLRLWSLTVLQAPAAAHAVSVNQIRTVPVDPTRGLILDRYGNPLVANDVVEQITLSRVAAQQHPEVVGRLAALIGETTAQVNASIADLRNSIYKPVPVLTRAPLEDVLYIKEHQDEFPGVSSVATTQRKYPQLELPGPAQNGYPASQTLGYVSTIDSAELASRTAQGYQAGDAFGQSGLEYQYESQLRGTPGQQQLEVDPKGQVVGTLKTTQATPGDNLVTNIDTNLQQVADNALATQIGTLRNTYDPACLSSAGNKVGCYPGATEGAVVVMSPQTGAVYAMSSYPTYNLQGVGRRAQRRPERPAVRSDKPRADPQPSHPGEVHPGLHLQAQHGHRSPPDRADHPGHPLLRQRDLQDSGLPVQQHHLCLPRCPGRPRRHLQRVVRPQRVERRLLLQPGVPLLFQVGPVR